ncbi:MAG: XisI protein [Okeania sp. SIO3I5]|uniref:element excision factor XisI family protein n=1 Tax=Okeania sp. SIO3I5 TaxID=2607805 RepID=UPI0013BE8976|nr:XisI protein [Okeania sp. SIO3I5]
MHQCIIHIDIVENCILIQCNDTEESIVAKLTKMGIDEDRIRLGFIHPQHQEYIGKEI